MQTFDIYLNSGMNQGADVVFAETSELILAQNVRISREGRLEPRPGFTALSSGTFSSAALVAYDVANFGGRLVCLGDQCGQSRPTDLFEWIPSRALWRATAGDDTGVDGIRLPQLTDIRALGMLPDVPESMQTAGLAAGGGYVCVVIERLGTGRSVVNIFDPETDQSVLIEDVELERPVVCFAGGRFWIAGFDADADLITYDFTVASSETLTGPTTRSANANPVNDVAIKPCGTGFVIAFATSTTCAVFRYDSSGVQQATWTAFASQTDSVALACNGAGSLISVARQTSASLYELSTFNASGVLQNGPTSLFGGGGGSGHRLGMDLLGTELTIAGVDELNSNGLYQEVTQSTHAAGATRTYADARPEGAPVVCNGKCYIGWVDLTATNNTAGTYHVVSTENFLQQCFVGNQLCDTTTTSTNEIQGMASDGTKLYFVVLTLGQNSGAVLTGIRLRHTVYEAETDVVRRQMAQVGGELLISGGLPLSYGGRTLAEQGFAEKPVISFESEATSPGALANGVYRAIAVWEVYDEAGRILRSQPSDPAEHTLAGANDTINWRVTTPHSPRRHPSFADQAQTVRISVYRTEADEGVFFLDTQVTVPLTDNVAAPIVVQSRFSDASLIDNAVLYTQSQTPVPHVSPQPYRYVWPIRERAFAGALPEEESWAASKLLFPGEPVEWAEAGRLGFSSRVGQPITAVAAFETVGLVWTLQEIWQIPGRGPEHDGTGDFDAAAGIASPGGCDEWRSVIVTPAGAFFRMRPDRLMLLGRDGSVSWAGSFVQDTLAAFPDMVGAVFVRALDQVVFACNNEAGTDAVAIIYDLSVDQWFVDTLGEAVRSVSELDGRLVYVNASGVVKQQDADLSGTLATMRIETPDFRFFGASGIGDVCESRMLASFVQNGTIEASISYDRGVSWTSMGSYSITQADAGTYPNTAAGVVLGPVTKSWVPNIRTASRFRLRFDATGLRLHAISLDVQAEDGKAYLPARDKR